MICTGWFQKVNH